MTENKNQIIFGRKKTWPIRDGFHRYTCNKGHNSARVTRDTNAHVTRDTNAHVTRDVTET